MNKKKSTEPEQVIATTLLQSRLLIDAGLSACTADMRWNLSVTFWGKPILESVPVTEADQNKIMTKHGTQPYDVEAWDTHENDARLWNKIMLHHLDASWQDDEQEGRILKFYEDLPHQGFFDKKDFRHFTTKI